MNNGASRGALALPSAGGVLKLLGWLAFALLRSRSRKRPEKKAEPSLLGTIVKGALAGALRAAPLLLAERLARKALHRDPAKAAPALAPR